MIVSGRRGNLRRYILITLPFSLQGTIWRDIGSAADAPVGSLRPFSE
jgi:hypothetical protein